MLPILPILRTLLIRWLDRSAQADVSTTPLQSAQTDTEIIHTEEHTTAHPVPYDENLLERARIQWQFGDWENLAKLDSETLQHHPDRAKLALLVAAGHIQQDDAQAARQFTRLAQDWGCSKKLVSQILIAGVHNTLGRAAAASGQEQRAIQHFETSIAVGTPDSEVRLITQARVGRQLDQLGLTLGSGYLHATKAVTSTYSEITSSIQRQQEVNSTFSPEAYAFYQGISQACIEKSAPPFILIDSKSIPRSGLHYMKNTFARLLGDSFSFCEWYQEPGCCRKMPCALTGYAQQCKRTQTPRLRLQKSHDFELTDPVFTPIYSVQRVILVRNPIFLLTSWFALDQLTQYELALQKLGINMEKIWISHEPEVLSTAYQVMNDTFIAPSTKVLNEWMEEKTSYISGFLEKWVLPAMENPQPFLHVVRYEELNSFIAVTLGELHDNLPEETRERVDAWIHNSGDQFRARQNPFQAPSVNLTTYMTENAHVFQQNANKVVAADRSGVMQVFESS